MTTKIEKTPGPHGITLEMREIPRRTVEVVHEHTVTQATWGRYAKLARLHGRLSPVPNRRARRAMGRARGVVTPRPTLLPYEKA